MGAIKAYFGKPPLQAWHKFMIVLIYIVTQAIVNDYAGNRWVLLVAISVQVSLVLILFIDLVKLVIMSGRNDEK